MKKLVLAAFLIVAFANTRAQPEVKVSPFEVVSVSEETGIPSFILFNKILPDPDAPELWFRNYLEADRNFHLQFLASRTDGAGNRHLRFMQTYKSVPIEDAVVHLHMRGGSAHSANGAFHPRVDPANGVVLTPEEALRHALQLFPAEANYAWNVPYYEELLKKVSHDQSASHKPRPELVLVHHDHVFLYAFRVDIYSVSPLMRKLLWLNAEDGSLIDERDLLHDFDVVGKAHTRYSGIQTITCNTNLPGIFTLSETGRGGGIATLNGKEVASGGLPTDFTDEDNEWNNVNPEQDEVATDLHWGLEKTYDYYRFILNRLSIDDADYSLLGIAHMYSAPGEKMANAFWNGSYAFFGDGNDTSMNPLTSVDIVGHEISHGLTQMTAGLAYKNESGALNESFSDIFGKNIEHYACPFNFSWEIGKVTMKPGKRTLRSMQHPHANCNPSYYRGRYYYSGFDDHGGVHINSGVQNYWYYLLCEGGSGVREKDAAPYYIKPIGFDKAAQIVYSNLVNYLTPGSKYLDAANGSVAAAKMLFGDNSLEAYTVHTAWYAVGVLGRPQEPVSVPENAVGNEVVVFPNPAGRWVQVRFPRPVADASFVLRDLSGRVVATMGALSGNSFTIDLADLTAGLYLLEINESGRQHRLKVVKGL